MASLCRRQPGAARSGSRRRADDLIVNSFDTGISGINWQNFRSYAYSCAEAWDPNLDSRQQIQTEL